MGARAERAAARAESGERAAERAERGGRAAERAARVARAERAAERADRAAERGVAESAWARWAAGWVVLSAMCRSSLTRGGAGP
jgi:hypothetical protein